MKKFLSFVLVFTFSLILIFNVSCGKKDEILNNIVYLRSDIFLSKDDDKISAEYGYTKKSIDAEKNYYVIIKYKNGEDANLNYKASFTIDGITYEDTLKFNNYSCLYSFMFNVKEFNEKSFDLRLFCSGESKTVSMVSSFINGTISYEKALLSVKEKCPDLISYYLDENKNFLALITIRYLVKDNKPYYFIGFNYNKEPLKALLVDGKTSEILAIRNIL